MKGFIAKLINKEIDLPVSQIESIIEVPKDSNFGDYSFPCFTLSKTLKKNSVEIAKELASKISSKEFEKIQVVGPYINFFINKNNLAKQVIEKILKEKQKYGSSREGNGKKIIIDFSGPNIGKPMHIGHIRSTIIGDSLIKIANYSGYKTIGINYLGDIGLHIGKLIVAYELWLNKKALESDPTRELLRLYVKFCKEEKSEFQEGQDEDYEGNDWTKKAKEKLKLIENGDKKTIKIWKEIESKSIKGFNKIYSILNVKFDEVTGQSKFSESGKKEIVTALKKQIVSKDESGAFFVEFSDLPKKYVLRSNGTASYITQDIGAAIERNNKYKFDKMIYVTDYRQILHFKQLFEILNKFNYNFSKDCRHVPFGTINFGNEIVSTRDGKVILLEEVLSKTILKAKEEIKKRKSKGDSEKIAIASIKYAVLRSEPIKDISFDWNSLLSFEGNTGPYLLYSYARAKSILVKAKNKKNKSANKTVISETEKSLISKLSAFPEIVSQAYRNLSPNIIANYAFELAQSFNEFYHSNQVIGSEEEEFRLKLVESLSIVLQNALNLLGIQTIEKM